MLKKILDKINENNHSDQEEIVDPIHISNQFIQSLVENFISKPSGRRYSDYVYDLTYVLFLHSQITYKIFRTIIPLPSEQMLYKRYGTELKSEIENLLNSNQIKCILKEYRKELNSYEELFATIAYDSATVDPRKTNKSNLFLFNIQPFKGNLKSKIVHISLKEKGRTDESIKQLIHEIVEEGLKQGFHIVFVATDGETGTNDLHKHFGRFIDSL